MATATSATGGGGGGARGESVSDPQTPSGPGSSQLSGMFSRLKKRVVDTAWHGTENKVCDYVIPEG